MKYQYLLPLLFLLACADSPKSEAPIESPNDEFQRIDFHAHYRYDRDFLVPLLDEWNMKAVIIHVSLGEAEKDSARWNALVNQYQKYPNKFFLCSGFDGVGIDDPGYAERIINRLEKEIEAGATMVKVWKNFGMVTRDESGAFIQIDDGRLQPIWDFLAAAKIPVIAHIAEPLQAWRPLEEGNPHYNYYKNNPQYHAYQHPEIPQWEDIIAARDNWIDQNPDLTIIGAHMGSMSHDVDLVAERLDKFPNLYVETAARIGDLTRQDTEKMRAFFEKYQDRIMYGTDMGINSPMTEENRNDPDQKAYMEKMLSIHWEYFSGKDSLYYDSPMISFPINTKSLALPKDILKKFYYENAMKILNK